MGKTYEEDYKDLIEAIRRLNLGGDPEERAKEILKEMDLDEAIKYYRELAASLYLEPSAADFADEDED